MAKSLFDVIDELWTYLDACEDQAERFRAIEEIRHSLSVRSPLRSQPIDLVRWIPVEKVEANDYNPNSVAGREMSLLYTSIRHDGYTQPIVAIYDRDRDKYVIVDGFHRYFTCKTNADIREGTLGYVPVVVIDKGINDRMASTVRHNRARGEHSVQGMAQMVFSMLDKGWSDAAICNELGMEPEELLKLKHITGFSKLFDNVEYAQAWESRAQIKLRKEWDDKADEVEP
jgi:ParB-like chromosome segregation protein Spo0J